MSHTNRDGSHIDIQSYSTSYQPTHRLADWNIFNHGPNAPQLSDSAGGYQLHASFMITRSGCGINANTRPFGVTTPAIPRGLPFGFAGYRVAGSPCPSIYLTPTNSDSSNLFTSSVLSKTALPSPCATAMGNCDPSISLRKTDLVPCDFVTTST